MDDSRKSILHISRHPQIPLIFAGLMLLVLLYSLTGQWRTTLVNEYVSLKTGESNSSSHFTLDPDRRYTLELKQLTDNWKFNSWASLLVTLVDVESEEEVFELEDNYWAEHGVWREGGESGTWRENNAKTKFHFRVAEPGEYRMEAVLTEHLGRPEVQLLIKVSERKPVKLHWIPLLVGVVSLLILSLVIAGRRQAAMCKYLEKLTAGSTLKIRGELMTVIDVRTHREPNEPAGFEWRLRSESGQERYLAIETFEYDSEEEYNGRYLMIDIPGLNIQGARPDMPAMHIQMVAVEGTHYQYDPENSGRGTMETYFEGEKYLTRYIARTYRPPYFPRPDNAGARLVEHMDYEGSTENEWCVMEIVSWRDIDAIRINKDKQANT